VAAPSGVAHGDGDTVSEDDVTKFGTAPEDGHAGVQDVVTKLAGGATHGDGDVGCQDDMTKVEYDTTRGDGDAGYQDGVRKVACDAAHGDAGCQDGMTKVACGAAHGDGDVGCQDDVAKLAAKAMGSDQNPSSLILDVTVGRSVGRSFRDWSCWWRRHGTIHMPMNSRCVEGIGEGIHGQERRPGASTHGRARGGFLPSNSCLLYFSSIDYINRPVCRLATPI
jgi:hypothetical protein